MKKELGQFYTKQYAHILQDITIPEGTTNIIEPFAGGGDLLKYIQDQTGESDVESYDIDPQQEGITKRDTLRNPPDYEDMYVITNPPYLARNQSADKELYDKYEVNDLYKCFMKTIMGKCTGGILILPLNFISSTRKGDICLRKEFFSVYQMTQLNIFEQTVFHDTSATVCSFSFEKKGQDTPTTNLPITIHPSRVSLKDIQLNEDNNYTIGGDIYQLAISKVYTFKRLTVKNKDSVEPTRIKVKCIDDNSLSKISAEYVPEDKEVFVDTTDKSSARGYLTLVVFPSIDKERQNELVVEFNRYLEDKRRLYHSLFLANYRESTDIARKRISFSLVYRIMGSLLDE